MGREKDAVRILERLGQPRHLDEATLARIWSAARADGRAPTSDVELSDAHLASCPDCRARYIAFANWLRDVRADAVSEADEIFSTERLAAQQAQIFRRLEALERPARVIAFPRFSRPVTKSHGGPRRWITAAAAAGLIVGLAAGQLLDMRKALDRSEIRHKLGNTGATPNRAATVESVNARFSDEALLYDSAITAPRIPELQSLDAITPRVPELDQSR